MKRSLLALWALMLMLFLTTCAHALKSPATAHVTFVVQ